MDPAHRLVPLADQQKIIQQVELVEQPFVVTEHTAQGYWCEGCQCIHYAAFPAELVAGGLCGPRLTSLVAVAVLLSAPNASCAVRALVRRMDVTNCLPFMLSI